LRILSPRAWEQPTIRWAARVGDLIFVSGQIGNVPGTLELAPGGIQAEARQALANIASILERNGSPLERVAKCTVFLLDMAEWPALNDVWVATFPNKPARSALGASGLAKGARVEIECIAAAGRRAEECRAARARVRLATACEAASRASVPGSAPRSRRPA
jgi:reactive intermediate/imine deaminase